MKLLKTQQAARRDPSRRNWEEFAESLRQMIADVSRRILRETRDTAELRAEIEAVGFAAVWKNLPHILESEYDDEQQYLWHVEKIARPPMEKARDSRFRPCGLGHDRRRERDREDDQNCREQEAGHKLPERYRRAGGGVEHRECLNGSEGYFESTDDVRDDREHRRKVRAWRFWVVEEVEELLLHEPKWLRDAVKMAMKERRFGIGQRYKPCVSAIARELGNMDRRILAAALWKLGCLVAADPPESLTIDGVIIDPNEIGEEQLGDAWRAAAAEGKRLQLVSLLFDAA